jgi:hypothetical protein
LALKFLRVCPDNEKPAPFELPRDNAREIRMKGMERRLQHRAHYIG